MAIKSLLWSRTANENVWLPKIIDMDSCCCCRLFLPSFFLPPLTLFRQNRKREKTTTAIINYQHLEKWLLGLKSFCVFFFWKAVTQHRAAIYSNWIFLPFFNFKEKKAWNFFRSISIRSSRKIFQLRTFFCNLLFLPKTFLFVHCSIFRIAT